MTSAVEKGSDFKSFSESIEERNFRDEDYRNRRAFLRSYPLRSEEEEGKEVEVTKLSLKNRFKAALQWGEGKIVRLTRMRKRVAFRLVCGHPYLLKPTDKMLTC